MRRAFPVDLLPFETRIRKLERLPLATFPDEYRQTANTFHRVPICLVRQSRMIVHSSAKGWFRAAGR